MTTVPLVRRAIVASLIGLVAAACSGSPASSAPTTEPTTAATTSVAPVATTTSVAPVVTTTSVAPVVTTTSVAPVVTTTLPVPTTLPAPQPTAGPAPEDMPTRLPPGTYRVGTEIRAGFWVPDECGCLWASIDDSGAETPGVGEDAEVLADDHAIRLDGCEWSWDG